MAFRLVLSLCLPNSSDGRLLYPKNFLQEKKISVDVEVKVLYQENENDIKVVSVVGQHNFRCKKAKDMYHKELADSMKHFKEEGGRRVMCEAVEKYAKKKAVEAAIEAAIEAGISYGIEKKIVLQKVSEKYGITKEEVEELYDTYASAMA